MPTLWAESSRISGSQSLTGNRFWRLWLHLYPEPESLDGIPSETLGTRKNHPYPLSQEATVYTQVMLDFNSRPHPPQSPYVLWTRSAKAKGGSPVLPLCPMGRQAKGKGELEGVRQTQTLVSNTCVYTVAQEGNRIFQNPKSKIQNPICLALNP